jgi:hypothetical protein
MNRLYRCTIFALFFICPPAFGQNYISRISRTIGVISYSPKESPGSIKFGTGTLLYKKVADSNFVILLVTNKHVLPKVIENDSIHFKIRNYSSFADIGIRIYKKNGVLDDLVKIDPKQEDVAVINISPIVNRMKLSATNDSSDSTRILPVDLLSNNDILKRIHASIGDEVYFMGFPGYFFDRRNISPILRQGIIASDPNSEFYFNEEIREAYFRKLGDIMPEKWNGFLIDASVFPGSSGSLVILKPQPHNSDFLTGNNLDSDRSIPYILGITTQSYFDLDPKSANGVRLNLSGVIASSVILRTIALFHLDDLQH